MVRGLAIFRERFAAYVDQYILIGGMAATLAHEDGRSSRSIYNKAEYAEQGRHMLQEWANMVDAWIDGQT